jgi:acetyl esterase/lipase
MRWLLIALLSMSFAPATAASVTRHSGIEYAQIEGVEPRHLSLDLYTPAAAHDAPIMLYVHGGGWSLGDKGVVSGKPAFFCGSGWLFASTNYRLVPEVTPAEQARDIARAVAWLHEHAAEFGGDPERIFLVGHSAGGHLVALVSTWPEPLQEVGLDLSALSGTIVLDAGALDLNTHLGRVGRLPLFSQAFGTDPAAWPPLSPLHWVAPDAGIPPMLIFVQGRPERVGDARRFSNALVACGVQSEVVYLPQHTHAMVNRQVGVAGDPTTEAIIRFLTGLGAPLSAGERQP